MKIKEEKCIESIFAIAACTSVVAAAVICIFLFSNGASAIREIGLLSFIFGQKWRPLQNSFGIFPMLLGSTYVTLGAIAVGIPLGVLCAVFLCYFCPKALYKLIKPFIDLLAFIPSIVYGFFALMVLVPMFEKVFSGTGRGIITTSVLLGIMILPTIVSISETALRSVPSGYYEEALLLGASKEQCIFKIVIPAAKSGIFTGVVLGIGRAIGETMAVVMIAGNQAVIPHEITSGIRTLTSNIVLEMGYASGLHRKALIASSMVLFVFILLINLLFSFAKGRIK